MFKSALLRLTIGYLTFIMLLSVGFSELLYRVSTKELERDLAQRVATIKDSPFRHAPGVQELINLRTEQIEESKDHLQDNLATMNLIILAASGALAYLLAKRNLQPIEEAHEAQSRFTADASHELRTPLTAMRSEIEVALRDRQLTLIEAKRLLTSNLEEVAKLDALSDGLLKLARQEQTPPAMATINLAEIMAEAVEAVIGRARQADVRISTDIPAIEVRANRLNLIEVLTILLDNAIKYSPQQSLVSVIGRKNKSMVVIQIQDQGIGIQSADVPYIFDRFYRADQARSKEQVAGYGLGLAIAKQIVEAHAGTIRADSQPGVGTTMIVTLPISQK